MGYEKLYESNSLAAISRALRSTQTGAAPSSRPAATAEHVKQDVAALPNMKKRKQLVAQSLSTELPSKQSVTALSTRKKRRKSDEQGADTDTVADEAEKTPKSLKRKKMAKLTVESLQDGSEPQAEGPAEQARKRLGEYALWYYYYLQSSQKQKRHRQLRCRTLGQAKERGSFGAGNSERSKGCGCFGVRSVKVPSRTRLLWCRTS